MSCMEWGSVSKRSSWNSPLPRMINITPRQPKRVRLKFPRENNNEHTSHLPQGAEQLFPFAYRLWRHGDLRSGQRLFLSILRLLLYSPGNDGGHARAVLPDERR